MNTATTIYVRNSRSTKDIWVMIPPKSHTLKAHWAVFYVSVISTSILLLALSSVFYGELTR